MSTSTEEITTQISSRRRSILLSRLGLRLLIAFAISWLILLAFFVTSAVSH